MGKDTSMFAVTPLYEIKQVFIIVMTITTIILASIAYAELKEITGDVLDIINNWKLVPFTEVYVAPEGSSCLADEEEFSYKYGMYVTVIVVMILSWVTGNRNIKKGYSYLYSTVLKYSS